VAIRVIAEEKEIVHARAEEVKEAFYRTEHQHWNSYGGIAKKGPRPLRIQVSGCLRWLRGGESVNGAHQFWAKLPLTTTLQELALTRVSSPHLLLLTLKARWTEGGKSQNV
jgi:hypothetical protein